MQTAEISNNSTNTSSRKKMEAWISIGAGKAVENALNKVIIYQIAKYSSCLEHINRELKKFEFSYKITSDNFYRRFEDCELGDEEDFFEWGSFYENVLLYKKRIEELAPLLNE